MSGVLHGDPKATLMENLGALDWLGQGGFLSWVKGRVGVFHLTWARSLV